MTSHPATQHDVAAALGIAQRTVSRAFAEPETVRSELRERIAATAARLGYRPHAGARTLRTGRHDQVLLVQSASANTSNLPGGLLSGLLDGLNNAGVHLGIARFADQQLTSDGFLPRAISELRSDGLLINYTSNHPEQLSRHIARHRIPAIWLNNRLPTDCVHPDDEGAGRLITEHLIALGHLRIAWVDLFVEHTANCHYSRPDRRAGFRAAMTSAGLKPSYCAPASLLPTDAMADAVTTVLRGPRRVTALGCYSQFEANAALRAAALCGLRVPQDLSVALVDDHQPFLGLPMTTAVMDLPQVGRQAAQKLLARIAAPRRHHSPLAVPSCLHPGSSTAPLST